MELEHIREFVNLAETRNFAETADRLFTTQSTISKHLKAMETELGVRLFDRTSRRVELNAFGKLFLPYAQTILNTQYEYQTAIYNHSENMRSTLNIGSIPVMAQYHITDIIMRFRRENTHFTLNVTEAEPSELIRLIQKGGCELAFIRETGGYDQNLTKIPYWTDRLVALLPAVHPLANRELLEIRDLSTEDFLFIKEKTYLYDLCVKVCTDAGFTPRIAFSGHRIENIIDFVAQGMGIALLMKQQVAHLSREQFRIVPLSPVITSQISLVYRKDRRLSPAAAHFLNCTAL